MSLINIIENFENNVKVDNIDLTDDYQLELLDTLSKQIYSDSKDSDEIRSLETTLINNQAKYGLLTHTAVKIAKSKKLLSEIHEPVHLTIVFSIYKEGEKLLKKPESEKGEDSLMKKIHQINNLTDNLNHVTWDMIVVDAGCPEKSGNIALDILNKNYKGNNIKVIIYNDYNNLPNDFHSNIHFRKSSAVDFGMRLSIQNEKKNQIVIYMDSDLFIHAGQCGLLVEPIINKEFIASIGSGRESDSIIVKTTKKNIQEKLFIYFTKRVLKRLNYVTDIRYRFQAYSADFLKKIFNNPAEDPQAFDIEILLKAELLKRKSIINIAISSLKIDNKPEDDTYPYLVQLKSIVRMYHAYLSPNAIAHKFAYFIKSLTNEQWNVLSNNVPEGIQIKPAVHFDIYDEYTVEDFQKILEKYH
jgi:hypothetical protein